MGQRGSGLGKVPQALVWPGRGAEFCYKFNRKPPEGLQQGSNEAFEKVIWVLYGVDKSGGWEAGGN